MTVTLTHPWATFYRSNWRSDVRRLDPVENLTIGAHSDDGEILDPLGVVKSFKGHERLGVVIVNNGAGRPRAAPYEELSEEAMTRLRMQEQIAAARYGRYEFAVGLAHPSSCMQGKRNDAVVNELREILSATKPRRLVTHNPFDCHPSHIAVLEHVFWALEELRPTYQPEEIFGGEVWGGIDRVPEPYLVRWDCSELQNVQEDVLEYFTSQNAIKKYHIAVMARRRALAKLNDPHVTLEATAVHLAVDLRSVLQGETTLRNLVARCYEQMQSAQLNLYASRA
ncbi:MAG: PIG-L family deacetylase [Bdellovibrionota bacterium]